MFAPLTRKTWSAGFILPPASPASALVFHRWQCSQMCPPHHYESRLPASPQPAALLRCRLPSAKTAPAPALLCSSPASRLSSSQTHSRALTNWSLRVICSSAQTAARCCGCRPRQYHHPPAIRIPHVCAQHCSGSKPMPQRPSPPPPIRLYSSVQTGPRSPRLSPRRRHYRRGGVRATSAVSMCSRPSLKLTCSPLFWSRPLPMQVLILQVPLA